MFSILNVLTIADPWYKTLHHEVCLGYSGVVMVVFDSGSTVQSICCQCGCCMYWTARMKWTKSIAYLMNICHCAHQRLSLNLKSSSLLQMIALNITNQVLRGRGGEGAKMTTWTGISRVIINLSLMHPVEQEHSPTYCRSRRTSISRCSILLAHQLLAPLYFKFSGVLSGTWDTGL